jgi:hypothetical protein
MAHSKSSEGSEEEDDPRGWVIDGESPAAMEWELRTIPGTKYAEASMVLSC